MLHSCAAAEWLRVSRLWAMKSTEALSTGAICSACRKGRRVWVQEDCMQFCTVAGQPAPLVRWDGHAPRLQQGGS